ncbi:Cytochrome P450 [Macrophomina phaseolina MS6]|uniref:Cytochrome P450 n=1 Tax=Macrophomina phaseolina (strain MS6) TaxID=1126212 RepID=K2RI33_MACPH|nr:Cytochrome P450 [Macrophomina phaseolina MS6]
MILQSFSSLIGQYLWIAALAAVVAHFTLNYFTPGVRKIPGPFLAKFTNLWRFYDVWKGRNDLTLNALHHKYGDNVRLGPNVSKFYAVQQQMANGKPTVTLFTSLSEQWHANIKRPIANAYSMTTLTDFEPFVDNMIALMFSRLDALFATTTNTSSHDRPPPTCPLFDWLQFYAFDVIGELTCSHDLGFLSTGRDMSNIIRDLNATMDYNALVGQLPWLDHLLIKNPLRQLLLGANAATGPVARFARARLDERLLEREKGVEKPRRDFMARFFEVKETHPAVVDDKQVFSLLEIYKLLPSLFLRYDIQLVDPKAEWKITNSWFARQEGVEFHLTRRMDV